MKLAPENFIVKFSFFAISASGRALVIITMLNRTCAALFAIYNVQFPLFSSPYLARPFSFSPSFHCSGEALESFNSDNTRQHISFYRPSDTYFPLTTCPALVVYRSLRQMFNLNFLLFKLSLFFCAASLASAIPIARRHFNIGSLSSSPPPRRYGIGQYGSFSGLNLQVNDINILQFALMLEVHFVLIRGLHHRLSKLCSIPKGFLNSVLRK